METNYIKDLIRETQEILSTQETHDVIDTSKPVKKIKNIISIASGKGGVGKTTLSVNISLALKKLGMDITLLDADLGLADGDILMGLNSRWTLIDYLNGSREFHEIVQDYHGINYLSVGSGIKELANLEVSDLEFVFERLLTKIDSEFLLIDTGAGISRNTTFFLERSDYSVIIATPEPTSFVDAYQTIKTMFRAGYENILLLINRAYDEEEALDIFTRINNVSKKSLGKEIEYIGFIPEDRAFQKALYTRKPLILNEDIQTGFFIEKVSGLLYNSYIKNHNKI